MPRSRPLDRSKPLEAFASDLRRLRDSAPPREYRPSIPEPGEGKKSQSSQIPEPFGVDQVVAKYGVGRSSIYAALSAKRLPSVTVLRAMVLAWAPAGEATMRGWMHRRREVEVALATSSSSPAAETSPARHSESESAQRARPAALRPAPEYTTPSSPDVSSSAAAPTAITNEVQELYRAAGSPPVRAISAAILADSRSADISPETVRRVVAGTSARHTSVLSVVRALAEIGGHDAAAAEEKARRLQDLEEPSDAQGSSTRPAVAEAAGVDLRGCVIYGLQLTSGDGQTVDLRHAVLHNAVVHAGDQQTLRVTDSWLQGTAVHTGDQQTLQVTDSSLQETAVQTGDQQTLHVTDSSLQETTLQTGDQQTLHVTDSSLQETTLQTGDQQTLHVTDSSLQDAVAHGQRREALSS
ncbi:putative DNA-binding transcriptional regulator AlpA [Streptomyces sp. TE12347]